MGKLTTLLLLLASLFLASCGGGSSGSSEGSGFTTRSLSEMKAKAREPEAEQTQLIPDELIIKVKEGEDTRIVAQQVAQELGGQVIEVSPPYALIKLRSGVSAQSALQAARANPKVEIAEQNRIIRIPKPPERDSSIEPMTKVLNALKSTLFRPYSANPNPLIPNDPRFGELWGMHKILAPQAWNSNTGSNTVIVAVLDTGIDYNHEDLNANMWRNPGETSCNDSVDNDNNGYVDDCHGINAINNSGDPMDNHGHGTHVAGTIGAVANNARGVAGVNWQVKLLACKFLGPQGGTLFDQVECINYVIALKDRGENIVAVNASYGRIVSSPDQMERDAINRLRQNGILFVAAAGNEAWNNDSPIRRAYPCSLSTELDNVVCVASTGKSNLLSPFSNYGANTVQVAAPGSAILSTLPNNGYEFRSGTSMAAPHVTGLAALIKAANPNFTYLNIKDRILSTVDQSPSLAGKVSTGGKINAYRALGGTNPVLLANPVGMGTLSGGGINCDNISVINNVCALAYASGASVSLTAAPAQGATLLDWGGSCSHCGRNTTCNVTVSGTTNCFATFYAPLSIDDGRSATVGVQNPPRATQHSFDTDAVIPGLAIDFVYDGNNYSRNTRAPDFKIASSPNLISFPDVDDDYVSINTPFPVSFYGAQY
ncbi:MAG: S8 family serine peptidase, partial [Aquificaceae bacterium]|nr:S8 family serine peptidase [Aquificaceae bacterium]